MPALYRGLRDGDAVAVRNGSFLDHDRVGAAGDDAAGEDAHGFTRADRPIERPAGGNFADHLQA